MPFIYRYICYFKKGSFYQGRPYKYGDVIEITSPTPPEGFRSTTADKRIGSQSSYRDLDGTWYMGDGVSGWDDEKFPFTGVRIDTSAGRIDYNYSECSVDMQANAQYPSDPICIISQMSHKKKIKSEVGPHIHWFQEEDNVPNFLMAHRWYSNGDIVPDFELSPIGDSVFNYVSGKMLQVSLFPRLTPPESEGLSSFIDIIIYRDSTNASGLFSGADPYTLTVKTKEFDIHALGDAPAGSGREFQK